MEIQVKVAEIWRANLLIKKLEIPKGGGPNAKRVRRNRAAKKEEKPHVYTLSFQLFCHLGGQTPKKQLESPLFSTFNVKILMQSHFFCPILYNVHTIYNLQCAHHNHRSKSTLRMIRVRIQSKSMEKHLIPASTREETRAQQLKYFYLECTPLRYIPY